MGQALSSSVFKPLNPSRQRWELDHPISIMPACALGHRTRALNGSVPLQYQDHLLKITNRKKKRKKWQRTTQKVGEGAH